MRRAGAKRLKPGNGVISGFNATPQVLRAACYGILGAAQQEQDDMVKRILAGLAFALAQEAQLAGERAAEPNAAAY